MQTIWRIVDRNYAKTAFNGEGARLYGGRWNSPGTAIVYAAEHQSLAILEQLVHLDSPALLREYVLFAVEIDLAFITEVDRSTLPGNWREEPVPEAVQVIGDLWVAKGESVALAVPSVLVPNESNYLLNPAHPDFHRLKIYPHAGFQFDERFSRKHR